MHLLKASSFKTKSMTVMNHSPDHTGQAYVACMHVLACVGTDGMYRYVGICVHGRSEVDAKDLVQSLFLLIH